MNEELKTKYPYITDKQWDQVNELEADYIEFLNDEDKKELEVQELEAQKMKREEMVNQIIDRLKQTEQSQEAQLIMSGAKVLQDHFFKMTGRYMGHDVMHLFIQFKPFRGLRIYSNSWEKGEEQGYDLQMTFTHTSGIQFSKTVSGTGEVKNEWAEVINEI